MHVRTTNEIAVIIIEIHNNKYPFSAELNPIVIASFEALVELNSSL